MSKTVVVGCDGSDASLKAVNWAIDNLNNDKTEFHFIHCFSPLEAFDLEDSAAYFPSEVCAGFFWRGTNVVVYVCS
eukprot:m.27183 g.27183  ORF g.27183 m.27183 type:complete len:76 (-) comp13894_c0_seq2:34-261(-)